VNKDDDIDEGWVAGVFRCPGPDFKEFGAQIPAGKNGQVLYLACTAPGKTNVQYSQWAPSTTEKPQFHSPKDSER